MVKKLLHWVRTGHWPKKMRFPSGVPRVSSEPVIRLWDKDWNLISTHTGSGPIHATVDVAGQRISGVLELVPHSECLARILTWPNPLVEGNP